MKANDEETAKCSDEHIYFAHPWTDYADEMIQEYLQNNRHLTQPNIYEILNDKILYDRIEQMEEKFIEILACCHFQMEDIPNIKWVTSFERETECIQFDDINTIILDFAQICDISQVALNCGLANEDLLAKYEYIRNQYARIVGKEIAFSESYDRIINELIDLKQLSNTRITYSLVNRSISDILFCNGYLDGAFHYCGRAAVFHYHKPSSYVRPNSLFEDNKKAAMLELFYFRQTSIFLVAHEVHHIELRRKFNALASHDRNQIPSGLFKRIFDWLMVYGHDANYLMDYMWQRFANLMEKRSQKIVEDLYEAFSGDIQAYKVIDACKDSILSWGKFNFNSDITKMTDNEYNSFINTVTECYCDVMALYDLLNAEHVETFEDVCSAVTTILSIMTIQEANHIASELIDYMGGKINEIHSANILRLQIFFFAVVNESMHDKVEILTKIPLHNDMNWNCMSETYSEKERMEQLMLGKFKSFLKEVKEGDFQEFYKEMFATVDIIYEYYYEPIVYEVFHVYQNGFVCKECNSIYVKSEGIKLEPHDYEHGELVANLSSIIMNNNIKAARDAGVFYLNKDKKFDVYGNCIIDTAPLTKVARVMRIDQLIDLFAKVRKIDSKELLDSIKIK